MKPLKSETQDTEALKEIGRATVQVVHDLKNQLNGLKLYATFLRKRMEKSERPEDEKETVAKLIAGLERAAGDMTLLVRLSRPLELRRQQQTDLVKILTGIVKDEGFELELGADEFGGEFDSASITEALKNITARATGLHPSAPTEGLRIHLWPDEEGREAIIEWSGLKISDGDDPFHSLAGSEGIRMLLAAKIIEAHGGEVSYDKNSLRVRLPRAAHTHSAASS